MSKKTVYFVIFVFIFFSISIWSGFLDEEAKQVDERLGEFLKSDSLTKEASKEKLSSKTIATAVEEESLAKFANLNATEREGLINDCNDTIAKGFPAIIKKAEEAGIELSQEQQKAIDEIQHRCELMYDYQAGLSETEIEELIAKHEKGKEIAKTFIFSEYDPSLITKAHSYFENKSEDTFLQQDFAALLYLLQHDSQLVGSLVQEIGTKDKQLIKSNAFEIVDLYRCSLEPSLCSKSGGITLMECAFDVTVCGLDYYSIVSKSYTSNQMADFDSIIHALRERFSNL